MENMQTLEEDVSIYLVIIFCLVETKVKKKKDYLMLNLCDVQTETHSLNTWLCTWRLCLKHPLQYHGKDTISARWKQLTQSYKEVVTLLK